jgi:hypothetical protein
LILTPLCHEILGGLPPDAGRSAGRHLSAVLEEPAHLLHEVARLLAEFGDLLCLEDDQFLIVPPLAVLEHAVIEPAPLGLESTGANQLVVETAKL